MEMNMNAQELKQLIENIVDRKLNEMEIDDPELNERIEEFHKLKMQIDKLNSELKRKKKEFKEFDTLVKPILDRMKEADDKLGETEKYVIKVQTWGYERTNTPWKAAYELALSKVNKATERIILEAVEAIQKTSNVKTKYSLDRMEEANYLQQIGNEVRKWLGKFLRIFKRELGKIDRANKEMLSIIDQANAEIRKIKIGESVNEGRGINDPILMKLRSKSRKMKPEEKQKYSPSTIKQINRLEREREKIMLDMEQEAEMEGGPIADKYGDKLNKIDSKLDKLKKKKKI